MKLNALKFGLAAGIVWGLGLFLLTLVNLYLTDGYATGWLTLMGSIYPGYEISLGGSLIGLIFGFVDGFVCLGIFAWIYNRLI